MNQSGPGKDPSLIYTPPTLKETRPGIIDPNTSRSNSTNTNSISNKVPKNSDISITQKTLLNEEPDVIELSTKDTSNSSIYSNCAKSSNKSESRYSILASSSSLNNNQMSNDFSATKVPNTINNTNNTSETKVPIDASDALTGSILSTTLLSASTKTSSSSTVNVPINKKTNSNSNSSLFLKNNNNSMFNNVPCNNNNSNASENENMQMQSTPNRMINSFDIPLSTKSSSNR